MPINTIQFKGETYPAFQSEGFAARFAFPFADLVCRGVGYDIGCNRLEWALPEINSADPEKGGRTVFAIDPALGELNGASGRYTGSINGSWDAMNLPKGKADFIFSSHCLEHLPDWVGALEYWHSVMNPGGVLFLYLPDHSQSYWRPHHNRKHIHAFTPQIIEYYFKDLSNKWQNVFVSGVDLNNSFMVIAEKK